MVEWLVVKLGYSACWKSLFSTLPRLVAEADPEVQRRIIRRAEEAVYGAAGLNAYEAEGHSELQRLSRRSLAQHLCQRELRGNAGVRLLRYIVFALALPGLLTLFLLGAIRPMRPTTEETADLVIFFWHERLYKFVQPGSFGSQSFALHRTRRARFRGREASFFLRAITACPRLLAYPELLCNFVRWLAYYGFAVFHFRPRQAVVHFFENTASSSLMTAYLHERSLRHIDVQHGEMFFLALAAFCSFDEVRVWGEQFRGLLVNGRSPGGDIRVAGTPYHRSLFHSLRNRQQPRPARLLIIDPFLYEDSHYVQLTRRVLCHLDADWEVRVRRHPAELRKTLEWLQKLRSDPGLQSISAGLREEPPLVPIEDALGKSRIVVGVASAALIEAWIAGCKVIHLAGGPCRSALMDRYGDSANVFYCDANCDDFALDEFLKLPALLNQHERTLVHSLVAVTEEPV